MDDRDDAFAAFVAGRSRALHRFAYVLTGDHGRAEDLLQSTLLKIYLAWSRIDDLGAVEQYTRRTMVRTQVSFGRRAARREVTFAEVPESPATSPGWAAGPGRGADAGVSGIEERDELWRALATLGARQRAVIVLRFYEDLTEAEIARVLDCSVGTVKSQLSRGLSRLQQRLPSAHPIPASATSAACAGSGPPRAPTAPTPPGTAPASTASAGPNAPRRTASPAVPQSSREGL